MRRLLWLAAGLALVATGVYLAGRAPSRYVLEEWCKEWNQQRMESFTLLRFHRSRADPGAAPDFDRRIDDLLRETKSIRVRGWEVVLVPAGARAPGPGFTLGARHDAPEPPPFDRMEVWIAPRGWLARAFAGP